MSNNYSEQIFLSIDTIISLRLNEVSFDKTEVCEIISLDKDNKNKYWVSNGSLKYEAYSTNENREYLVNQKVYVTIPQGNYDLRKLIIGSYSADETNENLYVNPFNHLVTSSSHNVSDINITTNTSGTSTSDSRDLEIKFNYSNTTNFDYIGLEFGLDTSSLQGTYKGTYSIELLIYNNKDEDKPLNTSRIILYNTDLYGNPYGLIPMLKFLHLFPFPKEIKNITDITKIRVLFAQDGNFEKAGDIKLQDIKLYFGYDSKVIDTNQLLLYLSQEQSIDYQKNDTNLIRNLYLEWQHIDNSGKLYIFNSNQNVIPNLEYYVYWMKYVSGYKKENENDIEESGTYWKTLETYNCLSKINPFRYLIELNTNVNTDLYKVGIKYKYSNETDWKYIEALGIVFNNLDILTPPGGTNSSQDSIRLELDEGDTGVYNYYGLDSNVVDHSYLKARNITAKFIDAITFDNEYLERVEWEFPSENSTMIVRLSENEWDKAQFKIKSEYLPGAMNNRIWCRAYFSTGEIRLGSLTLQFGEASTSGSAYKLNIDFVGNDVCIRPGKTIAVKAKFEREDGGTIDTEPIIKWSFYKNSVSPLILNNTEGIETTITAPADILNNYENFAILLAIIENYTIDNGLLPNLTAYLPIPAAADNYSYISGPTRIVYDALGNSVSLSKEKYLLFDDNYNIVGNIVWRLSAPTKNEKEYYSFIDTGEEEPEIYYDDNKFNYSTLEVPQFKLYNNEISLVPLSYIPKEPEVVCLTANLIEGEELITVWSLPIFTMQNTWQYDLINNWNGSFKINKEQGSLLAPLLVAGKKEGDNQFTGVMLGNVELTGEKASGLYGFLQGSARFYFTENGEAYIGNGDHHFHLNNDGELDIKVKNFDLNANNGALVISDSEGIKLGNKISISPNGTATIGGWNINANSFSHNSNKYYLGQGLSNQTVGDHSNLTLAFKAGNKFGVATDGTLYAKGGKFSGDISGSTGTFSGNISTAGSISVSGTLTVTGTGTIAGWTINTDSLQSVVGNVGNIRINSNLSESKNWIEITQTASFSDAIFKITKNGILHANGAHITGDITCNTLTANNKGSIAGWTIDSNSISKGGTVLSSGQTDGKITSSNIEINGGTINLPAYWTTVTINNTSIKTLHNYTGAFALLCTSQDIEGELVLEYYNNNKKAWSGILTSDTGTTPSGLSLVHEVIKRHPDGYDYWTKTTDTGVWINDLCSSSNSEYEWLAFGSTPNVSPARIRSNGVDMHLFCATNGAIYCGGTGADKKISTSSSGPSSLNVKTNLYNLQDNYSLLYQDLLLLNLYSYDYKYKNVVGDLTSDYGFIIDEIEALPILSQYFRHFSTTKLINKYNQIQEIDCDNPEYNLNCQTIHIKEWERDSYIKGLFVIVKTLQYKIDTLENEIKELKQNEI